MHQYRESMSTDSKQFRIFRCPSCESLLKLPKDSQARALKCPKCAKTVKIPATKKSASSPAESSGASAFAEPPQESVDQKTEEQAKPGDIIKKHQAGVLPEERSFDPTPDGLKVDRESRENWETTRHQRKKLEFGTTLTSTDSEEVKADPNAPPEVRRKRFVGGGSEAADSGAHS